MRFECNSCGKCCRQLRLPSEGPAPQQGPAYFLAPPGERGPTIFEWEKERLEAKANELGVALEILPLQVLFDSSTSGRIVALLWHQTREPCPFLNEKNLCMIYEDRPLACRAFPLFGSRVSWNRFRRKPFASALCPKAIEVKAGNREGYFRALAEAYGECYTAAERMDLALSFKDILLHRLLSSSLKFKRGPLPAERPPVSPVVGAFSLARSMGLLKEEEFIESLRIIEQKP